MCIRDSAHGVADAAVDERVVEGAGGLEGTGGAGSGARLAGLHRLSVALGHRDRAVERRHPAARLGLGAGRVEDLLQHVRDGDQTGRPEARQVRQQLLRLDAGRVPQPYPGPDAGDRHHAAEDVGHGQEQQDRGLFAGPGPEDGVEQLDGVVDLGEEVAVGERAALGAAGGTRGVDEGGEGARAEHAAPHLHLLVGQVRPGLREPVHVALLHDPHVPEVGQPLPLGAEGGGLPGGLGDEGDRAGVLEDPAGLEDGGGRVDGDGDQAGRPGREVQDRPLVDRAGHHGDPVARHQPLGDQPLRHGQHLVGELRRRDVAPAPVGVLAAERHGARVRAHVVERQVGERPVRPRRRQRRHGRLPHRPVQAPHLGRHQDRPAVHVAVGGGGIRSGHGRLLGRAAGELLAA